MEIIQPVIVIHGGAWAIPDNLWHDSIEGVKKAAVLGYEVLHKGGSAVDAVEAAVVCLENDPTFDAGRGSVLTYNEEVEMDALIMEGGSMNAGAVACIKNVKNPIKAARVVMDKSPHVLLVGEGAKNFTSAHGIESADSDYLVLPDARDELEKFKKFHKTIESLFNAPSLGTSREHDTVGCVALDKNGHVACATSTGGITAKLPGRVGDSPLVGCGGMADNETGAVSTTGNGEAITKCCLSKSILTKMSHGIDAQVAAEECLKYMKNRVKGYGGAITLSSKGNIGVHFTTERMAWAHIKEETLSFGLHPNEIKVERFR